MLNFEYRGYLAQANLNDHRACYEGQVTNTDDLIRFQGLSPDEVKKAFQDCVDLYLMVCKRRGIAPDAPKNEH